MSSFTWYRDKDGTTIRCLETGVAYEIFGTVILPLDPDDDDNVIVGDDVSLAWNLLESLCEKEQVSPIDHTLSQFRLEESEKARQQALRSNAEMMEDLDQAKQELAQLKVERDNLARDVEMLGLADNEYIRWHPYPEVVPAACLGAITMLVTMKLGVFPAVWHPRREVFLTYRPRGPEEELSGVIAWTHLPEPYIPKEDKDNE